MDLEKITSSKIYTVVHLTRVNAPCFALAASGKAGSGKTLGN
jgi:hypothetical protein